MCWSFEVSLATYAVSMFAGVVTSTRSFLFYNFVHMQLLEAMMWADQSCQHGWNQAATYASVLLLALQPLGSLMSATKDPPLAVLSLYAALSVLFLWKMAKDLMDAVGRKGRVCTNPPPDNSSRHLAWDFLSTPRDPVVALFLAAFFVPMAYRAWKSPDSAAYAELFGCLSIVAVSIYIGHRNRTWGSGWCFWANGVSAWMLADHFWKGRLR